MKKSIIVLFIAFISINAFSQSQGSLVVGGAFSLTMEKNKTEQGSTTSDGPSRTQFKFTPDLEYFLSESLSAGIGIGYTMTKTKEEDTNSEETWKQGRFAIAPYLKKYFPMGDKAAFYGKAQLSVGFGKNTHETKTGSISNKVESDYSGFSLGIIPGFKYDISEKIALEAELGFVGYSHDVDKSGSGNNEVKDITNTFEFSFVPNYFGLGIRYTLK